MNGYDWILEFRAKRGFKNWQIGDIANVSSGGVANWISRHNVPIDALQRLKEWDAANPIETGVTPHTPPAVLSALSQFDGLPLDYSKTIELRLFASLPASTWGEIGETVEMMPVLAYQAKGVDGLIKVKGKCMMPALQDGDYVMIRLADSADPGQIVVVRNGNAEYTLKRLRLINGKLVLSPDNAPENTLEAEKGQIVAVCIRTYRPAETRELL